MDHDHSHHHMQEHEHHAPGTDGTHHDHSAHAHHDHTMMGHDHSEMINDFKKRFWLSLILTLPVLLLSHMIQEMLSVGLTFPGDQYLLFALSSVIFFYGGWPFLAGLISEIKDKRPGMMTLIAVAITVAYVYSSAVVFGLQGMDFFWELATLIVIMLLGHWIEMRSVSSASRSLELLVQMLPSVAHKLNGEQISDIRMEDLVVGDLILVKPGEKIAADGIIVSGESYLNESMLTGESKPMQKKSGDQVIGGSLNGSGVLRVKVEHTGKESYLSKVIGLVQEAQRTKSRTQRLADKAALWLTVFALGGGLLTLFVWLAQGKEFSFALERMVTVMVISCPHALGLAIPLVVAISISLAAQKGLLIRDRTAFESAGKITTLVFDKTGTLTEGGFGVTEIVSFSSDLSKEKILALAAAVEKNSEHPIATGILREAENQKVKIPAAENFMSLPGAGIKATVEEKVVTVAGPGFIREHKVNIPESIELSGTTAFVVIDENVAGYICLADKVRPESKEAIQRLQAAGIKTLMLTGDNAQVAEQVSKELRLDGFFAEVLPHQKLEKIKELQNEGEFVAMTGDGVNDAPALAQADVGIAVGSGTDVAAETADIILVNSDPKDIASLIFFGKATYRKMIQNLIWATAYNAITLPLATGFVPGIIITPAVGALFMSLSTIVVALNAQTLKCYRN